MNSLHLNPYVRSSWNVQKKPTLFGSYYKSVQAALKPVDDSGSSWKAILARTLQATATLKVIHRYALPGNFREQLQRYLDDYASTKQGSALKDLDKLVNTVQPSLVVQGSGSGFWIKQKNGKPLLLTNTHVIESPGMASFSPKLNISDNDSDPIGLSLTLGPLQIERTDVLAALNRVTTFRDALKNNAPVEIPLTLARQPNSSLPAACNELDLAVLEADGDLAARAGIKTLPVELGCANVGDEVIKIGNSLGIGGNTACGIISAFRPPAYCKCGSPDCVSNKPFVKIESTAMINPGDSGGPLINRRGKVIGMNQSRFNGPNESNFIQGVGHALTMPDIIKLLKSWGFELKN